MAGTFSLSEPTIDPPPPQVLADSWGGCRIRTGCSQPPPPPPPGCAPLPGPAPTRRLVCGPFAPAPSRRPVRRGPPLGRRASRRRRRADRSTWGPVAVLAEVCAQRLSSVPQPPPPPPPRGTEGGTRSSARGLLPHGVPPPAARGPLGPFGAVRPRPVGVQDLRRSARRRPRDQGSDLDRLDPLSDPFFDPRSQDPRLSFDLLRRR